MRTVMDREQREAVRRETRRIDEALQRGLITEREHREAKLRIALRLLPGRSRRDRARGR